MSKLVRRIIALVLGVVIGATALVGGISGGAMWAYRNVKPIEVATGKDAAEGTLQDASVEELLALLQSAKADSDKYDIARLEEEYGLSLADLLASLGVDIDSVNEKDLEALRNVTVFSLLDEKGMDKFLSSVKVRSLYVFMSALSGTNLDSVLSKEAQEIIGEKTLKELFSSKPGSNYIGIMEVLRELKLGAFFPAVYDAVYDENKHEYTYTLKEELKDKRKGLVTLMGDMPLSALFNLMDGSSITKEFLEGGLRYISEKPLAEVITALGENIGVASAKESMKQVADALGNEVTLLDIITRGENGEYLFDAEEILRNFKAGYILGYYLGDDGEWYTDEALTEKATGMMGVLASMKLSEIFDGNETIDTVKAMFGDVSLMTFFETFAGEDDEIPAIVDLLKDMTVDDILAAGSNGISKMLVDNLDLYLSQFELGNVIGDLLSDEVKEVIDSSNILTALMGLNLGDFIKKEYTPEVIMKGFAKALDELTLGNVLEDFGVENFWTDDAVLSKIFDDITVADILNIILGEENGGTTFEEVFDVITLGDLFGSVYGYEKNADGIWTKGDKVVTDDFNEFLETSLISVIQAFVNGDTAELEESFNALTFGDVLYSLLEAADMDLGFAYENGKVYVENEKQYLEDLSAAFMGIEIGDFINNYQDADWWEEKIGDIVTLGDVFGMIYGYEKNEDGVWVKEDKVVTDGFNEFLDTPLYFIIRSFVEGDTAELEEIFNTLTFGDLLYSLFEASDMELGFVYENGKVYIENEKQYLEDLSAAFMGIEIGDFINNYQDADWWEEKIGDIVTLGDVFGMIYGYEKNEDGVWVKEDKVVTDKFNDFLGTSFYFIIRSFVEGDTAELEEIFNTLTFGDLLYSLFEAADMDLGFVYENGEVYIANEQKYLEDLSAAILGIQIGEFIENYEDPDWWEAKLGDIVTLGDIFGMVYGYERNEDGVWAREDRIVTDKFNDFLGTSFYFIVRSFVEGDTAELEASFNTLTFGDVLYSMLEASGTNFGLVYEDGQIYLEDKFIGLSAIAMGIEIGDFIANYEDPAWWEEKFGETTVGDIIADLINDIGDEETRTVTAYYDTATGKWIVISEVMQELLNNVYNVKITDIGAAFENDDTDFFVELLGDTDVFDLIDLFDLHYIYGNTLTKLYSIKLKDIIYALKYYDDKDAEHYVSLEELFGEITLGDIFADIFGYEKNEDGIWANGEKVVTDRFNDALDVKVIDLIIALVEQDDDSAAAETLLLLTPGDIAYSFLEALDQNEALVYEDGVVTVDNLLGRAADVLLNVKLGDYAINYYKYKWWRAVLGDLDVGDFVVDLFNEISDNTTLVLYGRRDEETGEWIAYTNGLDEVFTNIYNVKISDLIDAIENKDYDFFIELLGETTVRNIADMITRRYKYGNVLTKLMSIKLKDIIYTLKGDMTWEELLGVITLGDVFGDIYGYEKNDEGIWAEGDKVVTDGFNEFLELDLVSVISSIIGGTETTVEDAVQQLTPGDVLYSMFGAFDYESQLAYEDGIVFFTEYLVKVSKIALNIKIGEYVINYDRYKWWVAKFGECFIGDFVSDLANAIGRNSDLYIYTYFDEEADKWNVEVKQIRGLLTVIFNTKIAVFENGARAGFDYIVDQLKVGDVAADAIKFVLTNLNINHNFTWIDGDYDATGRYEIALDKLYNKNLSDTLDLLRTADGRTEFLNEFLIGDVMADSIAIAIERMNGGISYGYIYDETEDRYTVTFDYAALPIEKTFNAPIGDYMDVIRGGRAGLVDFYGDLRLGDFVGDFIAQFADKLPIPDFSYALEKTEVLDANDNIVTYDYEATGWFKIISEALLNMTVRVANDTFTSVSATKDFIYGFNVGDYVYDIAKFAVERFGIGPALDYDGAYVVDGDFKRPVEKTLNTNLRDFKDAISGGRAGIVEFYGEFKLGEFAEPILSRVLDKITFGGVSFGIERDDEYNYSATGWFNRVLGTVYDMTVETANDTFTSVSATKDFIYGFNVGDYVYDIAKFAIGRIGIGPALDYNGAYVVDGDFERPVEKTMNTTLGDFKDVVSGGRSGIVEFYGEFKLGEFAEPILSRVLDKIAFGGVSFGIERDDEYNYLATGWFNRVLGTVYDMTVETADDTFTSASAIKEFFLGFKLGDYAADVMKFVANKSTINTDFDYEFVTEGNTYFGKTDYYVFESFFDLPLERVMNVTAQDFVDTFTGGRSAIVEFFGDLKIGDFIGKVLTNATADFERFSVDYEPYIETATDGSYRLAYDYSVSGVMMVIADRLFNMSITEADRTFGGADDIKEFLFGFRVGDYLCEVLTLLGDAYDGGYNKEEIVADTTAAYDTYGDYEIVLDRIVNITLNDFKDGLTDDALGYLFGSIETDDVTGAIAVYATGILGDLYVGNLFGKGRYDFRGGVWYESSDPAAEAVEFTKDITGVITKHLYKKHLYIFTDTDHLIDNVLGGLYIGELLGKICAEEGLDHEHDDDCIWLEEVAEGQVYIVDDLNNPTYTLNDEMIYVPIDAVSRIIAGREILSLLRGNGFDIPSLLGDAMLGELFGLIGVKTVVDGEDVYVWYEKSVHSGKNIVKEETDVYYDYVPGERSKELYQAVSSIYASALFSGDAIDTIMGKLKGLAIGYIMGYEKKIVEKDPVTNDIISEKLMTLAINYEKWKDGTTVMVYTYDGTTKTYTLTVGGVDHNMVYDEAIGKYRNADGSITAEYDADKDEWKYNGHTLTSEEYTTGWFDEEGNEDTTNKSKWYNSSNSAVTGITGKIADFTMNAIITGNASYNSWLVGDLLDLDYRTDGIWYESSSPTARPATGVIALLANLTIGDLSGSTGDGFLAIVRKWVIGNILESKKYAGNKALTYDAETDTWNYVYRDALENSHKAVLLNYDEAGNCWKDIRVENNVVVETVIVDTYDSVNDEWKNAAGTIVLRRVDEHDDLNGKDYYYYIDDDMTYIAADAVWKKDDNHEEITGLNALIYDYTVYDLMESEMTDLVQDWRIGDILGATYDKNTKKWTKGGNEIDGLDVKIYSLTVRELMSGFDNVVGEWFIGDIMGYEMTDGAGLLSAVVSEKHYASDTASIVVATDPASYTLTVGGVDYVLTYNDVTGKYEDGTATIVATYNSSNDTWIYDASTLTYAYSEYDWYVDPSDPATKVDENAREWKKDGNSTEALNNMVYSITVNELKNAGFKAIVGGWQIGQIMGYEKLPATYVSDDKYVYDSSVGAKTYWFRTASYAASTLWKEDESDKYVAGGKYYVGISNLNNKIFDLTIDDMDDFKNNMSDWTIAEIIGLDGSETGVLYLIGGLTVAEISDTTVFNNKVNGWHIGYLMDYTKYDTDETTKLVYDETNKVWRNASTDAIVTNGVWINGSAQKAAGINARIYDLTVSQLKGGFGDIMGEWFIGEILDFAKYTSDGSVALTYEAASKTWKGSVGGKAYVLTKDLAANTVTLKEDGSAVAAVYDAGEGTVTYNTIIFTYNADGDKWTSGTSSLTYAYTKYDWYNGATKITDGIWKNGAEQADTLDAKIYDLTVNQLKGGFNDVIADWRLGEVLGLNGTETGILGLIGDLTVGEVSDATAFNAEVNSWTLTEVLDLDGTETGVLGLIGDLTIGAISDATAFQNEINGWHIGEIMSYEPFEKDPAAGGHLLTFDSVSGKWTYNDGATDQYVEKNDVLWFRKNNLNVYVGANTLSNKIYCLTVDDMKGDFNTVIGDWQLGEILGKYTNDGGTTWYSTRTGEPGSYVYSGEVTGITKKILKMTIGELEGDGLTGEIDGWHVGDLLNLYHNDVNGAWYEDSSMSVPAKGVIGLLAGLTVSELSESTAFRNTVNGWFIGHVLEYNKYDVDDNVLTYNSATGKWEFGGVEKVGYWKKNASDAVEENIQGFYDLTVGELINGDFTEIVSDIVSEWKIGMLLGYYQYGPKWFRTRTGEPGSYVYDNEVTGITATLADKTVAQLAAPDGFKSVIDGLTLGDVVDTTGNSILAKLADKPVNSLNTAMQNLYLGEIMGYAAYDTDGTTPVTNDNGVWKNGDTPVATNDVIWKDSGAVITDKLTLMIVRKKVSDMNGNFADTLLGDIKTQLTLADLGLTGGILDILNDKDATIGSIGATIDTLYLGEVMGYYTDDAGAHWYTDNTKATEITDDIKLMMAGYKIGDIDGDFVTAQLLPDVKNLPITNFLSGTSGLMVFVDDTWTLNNLQDKLTAALNTSTIDQMIEFGAFGTYFNITDDKDVYETEMDNYRATDRIFQSDYDAEVLAGTTTATDVRHYWIDMGTSGFISKIINSAGDHYAYFEYQDAAVAEHVNPETYSATTSAFAFYKETKNGALESYASAMNAYATFLQSGYAARFAGFLAYTRYTEVGGTEIYTDTYIAFNTYKVSGTTYSTYEDSMYAYLDSGTTDTYVAWISAQT